MSTTVDIVNACTVGRQEECRPVVINDSSKFIGSVWLGLKTATPVNAMADSVCLAIGAGTIEAAGLPDLASGFIVAAI